jgi:asparaginyl-tRNA synthetase
MDVMDINSTLIGKFIEISGWVELIRIQKNVCFIQLNDGTTSKTLQIVIDLDDDLENNKKVKEICKGICISIFGVLEVNQNNINNNGISLDLDLKCNINNLILFKMDEITYPFSKNRYSMDYLRENLIMRHRTKIISNNLRIRSTAQLATHLFFTDRHYTHVATPLITSNDCEGAGETFSIEKVYTNGKSTDFFNKKVYLTVSGQLHGEALALGLKKIYTFGPTFRAEKSNTTRHLSEFWMIEPEVCFINLKELMDLAEDYLKFIIKFVIEKNKEEYKFIDKYITAHYSTSLLDMCEKSFKRLSYTEAVNLLKDDFPELIWGDDLSNKQELHLTQLFGITIVYNYPTKIKSFYMKKDINEQDVVQAMDVLIPDVGELIGGSIREESYSKLNENVKDKQLNLEQLDWYINLRRFGSIPHGGFGIGFERLIMFLTNTSNIKDVIPYPRYNGVCQY